ncbi:MAG: GIY-YIG nuclease family protein [Syntrophobacteraceae bacterium]|jgi:putative endonuclease
MWVYFIECEGGSIYTGIAKDVAERYEKHVNGKGAIYTKLNPPVRFLAAKEFQDDTEARKLEWKLKRLSREKKMQVVEEFRKNGIRSLEGSLMKL